MKYLLDFLIILLAVGVWEIVWESYKKYKNRDIANLLCDFCKRPRKTRRTKDRGYWACNKCRALYNSEMPI